MSRQDIHFLYGKMIDILLDSGYICDEQEEVVEIYKNNTIEDFFGFLNSWYNQEIMTVLDKERRVNYFEKLTNVWTHPELNDGDQKKRVLLYFANTNPLCTKQVNKEESMIAFKYMCKLDVKVMYFAHINPISNTTMAQFNGKLMSLSNNYIIRTFALSMFEVDPSESIYTPKHELVPISTLNGEFYTHAPIEMKNHLKITINDPAIAHLKCNVGDVIKITRTCEVEDMSSVVFRIVTGNKMEVAKCKPK